MKIMADDSSYTRKEVAEIASCYSIFAHSIGLLEGLVDSGGSVNVRDFYETYRKAEEMRRVLIGMGCATTDFDANFKELDREFSYVGDSMARLEERAGESGED